MGSHVPMNKEDRLYLWGIAQVSIIGMMIWLLGIRLLVFLESH